MNVLIALQERVKGCWMFILKYFARFVISKRMLLSGSEMEKKNLINLHCEVISIVVKIFFFFFPFSHAPEFPVICVFALVLFCTMIKHSFIISKEKSLTRKRQASYLSTYICRE